MFMRSLARTTLIDTFSNHVIGFGMTSAIKYWHVHLLLNIPFTHSTISKSKNDGNRFYALEYVFLVENPSKCPYAFRFSGHVIEKSTEATVPQESTDITNSRVHKIIQTGICCAKMSMNKCIPDLGLNSLFLVLRLAADSAERSPSRYRMFRRR